MKQKEKGQQLNKNAGFSLLELLIAVTILAIITIPMLHMFVTSARINGKSRITLRATVLAQDIVEGLKAYHIDEIQDQFNTKHLDMLNSTITCEECKYDDDGSNVYYFYLKNVKLENSMFDAKIKLMPVHILTEHRKLVNMICIPTQVKQSDLQVRIGMLHLFIKRVGMKQH